VKLSESQIRRLRTKIEEGRKETRTR